MRQRPAGACLSTPGAGTGLPGKWQVPAVWIILNDGRYNMCFQGMAALNMAGEADACFPPSDFALLARSMGAEGIRVERESDLDAALVRAMAATGPVVLDVLIDADQHAPTRGRNEGLRAAQAVKQRHEGMSFPVVAAN